MLTLRYRDLAGLPASEVARALGHDPVAELIVVLTDEHEDGLGHAPRPPCDTQEGVQERATQPGSTYPRQVPAGPAYVDPLGVDPVQAGIAPGPTFVTSVDDQGRSLGEVEQLAAFCGCSLEFWQNKYELRGTFGVGRYATLPEVVAALKAQRFTPAAGIALPPTSPEFEQHRRAAVSPEHMPKAEPPAHLRTGSQVQANMLPGETGAQYLQRTRQHVPEVVVLSITGTEYRNTRLD